MPFKWTDILYTVILYLFIQVPLIDYVYNKFDKHPPFIATAALIITGYCLVNVCYALVLVARAWLQERKGK